jgi:hypothetical protein
MKRLSISDLIFDGNEFFIQTENTFYLRCSDANNGPQRTINFTNNLVQGGLAITIYDWTSNPSDSNDIVNFSNNQLNQLSGGSKVVGVTLWCKNLTVVDNNFSGFEDKVFQFYGLSDTIDYSSKNSLNLGSGSQSRAYSRNYLNTAGSYITDSFWLI